MNDTAENRSRGIGETKRAHEEALGLLREGFSGVSCLIDDFKSDNANNFGMSYEQEMMARLNPELSQGLLDAIGQVRDSHRRLLDNLSAVEDSVTRSIEDTYRRMDDK